MGIGLKMKINPGINCPQQVPLKQSCCTSISTHGCLYMWVTQCFWQILVKHKLTAGMLTGNIWDVHSDDSYWSPSMVKLEVPAQFCASAHLSKMFLLQKKIVT